MAAPVVSPIAEAVANHGAKTPIGSRLRSAEWARIPTALRNRAQFSAGVESARVLQRIQNGVGEILGHYRNENGALTDRSGMIRDITQLAIKEGLAPSDPKLRGGIQDITSEARAELIVQQQVGQAYGHSNWKAGQDEDALDAFPAQELVRIREAKVPRNWRERWTNAGGRFFDGRMIALKTDSIWQRISRFGNPWPPFDFNSGMWVEDVSRYDAQRFGLIQPSQQLAPNETQFNSELEAQVTNLSPELRQNLQSLFGPQVEVDEQTVRWKDDAWSYERAANARRPSAKAVFSGVATDLGANRPRYYGDQAPSGVSPADLAITNAAEISSVASGRKPLYHERVAAFADPDLVARIQARLPPGVHARTDGSSLYVWHDDLVGRLADPSRPVWDQVREHSDDGRWLGYGQQGFGGKASVQVSIVDPAGELITGFWTPRKTAKLYGAARAMDYYEATGHPFSYVIHE